MPFFPVEIPPGVYPDLTPYGAEGKWLSSNRIRFRDGLPEPIGGWQKLLASPVLGVPRSMHSWSEIDGTKNVAVGTSTKLYTVQGSTATDITPVRDSGTLGSNPITITSGSALVSIADTAHGLQAGDSATFGGAAAVDNVTVDGEYIVTSITDDDNYVITYTTTADSSTSGGGASVTYSYQLSIGVDSSTFSFGFGAGSWNDSTWNTARTASNTTLDLRIWSMMNFGEDLLASPRGYGLYVWDASVGIGTPAAVVSAAPTAELFILSPDDRHVIALGAGGDPSKIQWCDQGDYTNWTQSASTTAGERQLLSGSKIVTALVTKTEIIIWTDVSVHSLRFVGGDFTFDLSTIGDSNGAFGIAAPVERNGVAFWMANGTFQLYDGTIKDMACSMLRHVFDDIDRAQKDKVTTGMFETRQEIWWFYPSADGGGENDKYVKYNWKDNAWDFGDLDRTSYIDSDVFSAPLATDASGEIYEHELSDHTDEDGAALGEFIESGDIDISNGKQVAFMNRLIPDFVGGPVDITFKSRMTPGSTQVSYGPFNVQASTTNIRPRVRGRRVAVRLDGDVSGVYWRFGRPIADIEPDGEE